MCYLASGPAKGALIGYIRVVNFVKSVSQEIQYNVEILGNPIPTQVVICLPYFQYDENTATEPAYFPCIFGAFPPGSTKIMKNSMATLAPKHVKFYSLNRFFKDIAA